MKTFLSLILAFLALGAKATDRYISVSGSDGNAGTSGSPWRTLSYAAANSSSGDVIHVAPGTYVESSRVNLPAGVSIIGAGTSSIIKSNYSVSSNMDDAIIRCVSSSINSTGQVISNLMLDGQNWNSLRGISITDRNNVEVSNCTIQNFKLAAISINANSGDGAFVSGISIHDCIINDDCSIMPGGSDGDGSIVMHGVNGLKIYNNSFTQTAHSPGSNGDIIRAICTPYFGVKNLKIYNNTFTKNSTEGSEYNFTIELWILSDNCEIYGNTFNGTGGVDVCGITKGNGTYGLSIHDNIMTAPANFAQVSGAPSQQGVNFEDANSGSANNTGVQQYIYVYNNYFKYIPNPLRFDFTISNSDTKGLMDHIYVYNNVFDQFGYTNNVGVSIGVYMNEHSQSPITYDNIHIYNNTFVGNSYSQQGVYWNAYGSLQTNFSIDNNIFYGLKSTGIYFNSLGNSPTVNTISVQNNDFYNNANNSPVYGSVSMNNKTEKNNTSSNPKFVSSSDYHLQAGSPAIDAGLNVGLPFAGNAPDIGRYEYGGASSTPVANAGPDQTITLPINSDTLGGIGSESNGIIASYQWTQISGPSGISINSPNADTTTVAGLMQGVYQFQLTVTDSKGVSATDVMNLTVNAPNKPPVANAGSNQTLTLPVDSTILTGSGMDSDGSVVSYQWTMISGPSSYTITNSTSPVTSLSGLVTGVYQFQLQVTDNNGAIGTSQMQITVNPAANIPPVANAGPTQSVIIPSDSTMLNGSGTDVDGTVIGYSWTQLSGPSSATILSPDSAQTKVTGLIQGIYQFQLKVTDNDSATGTSTVQVLVDTAVNIPPVANAGPNKNLILPLDSVIVVGSGTDSDGTVAGYLWTELSGPSTYTIASPDSSTTSITGLVQGVYQFQLQVTDNKGAIGTSIMQVVVDTLLKYPPLANAGSDLVLTLPTDSAVLSGSGTSTNGPISAYQWTQVTGPTTATLTNAGTAAASVSGMVQGIYQFELKVTDSLGYSGYSFMQITVNPVPNIPPVANAGPDQTITLPTSSVSLAGSGTDVDGTVVSYLWTQLSGPSASTFSNQNISGPTLTGLVQGAYQFQLTVTDNSGATATDVMQITVNAATNIAPVANAGVSQTITLPTNSVALSGSGSDADGTVVSYRWTKISGPSGATISSPNTPATNVTGLVQGVYLFQLMVTDNAGATGSNLVQINVNPAPNIPPVANAGSNQIITLPQDSTNLSGSGSDADGSVVSILWSQVSGPSSAQIANPGSAATIVKGLVNGVYQFRIRVTDNQGATAISYMQVQVNSQFSIPPIASAGPNQTITLPASSVTLSGSAVPGSGTIVSYTWTWISGPSSFTITNPGLATSIVTGLVQGVYQYQLKVTDNNGAVGTSITQVIVKPAANIAPVANAGPNQTISLPASSVTLSGSGNDPDGSVVTYKWIRLAGPSNATITNPGSAGTTVTGLIKGTYQFQLQVVDNQGATGTSTMQVQVNPAPNIPPVASAGPNQTITLPLDSVVLAGSGSDQDGNVVSFLWTKISGPAAYSIRNPGSAATVITGLVPGIYQFQLKVTDNNGAIGISIVQVTVNPAPVIPPVANAGPNQAITLPTNSTTLFGYGTDQNGGKVTYKWVQLSGPSSSAIGSKDSSSTLVSGLVQGVYKFQLVVTNSKGISSSSTTLVTVSVGANLPPSVNAGPDQMISLPQDSVTLSGSVTDKYGTINSYTWREISGPSMANMASPFNQSTPVTGLVYGNYVFTLTVTDNLGGTATDTVMVIVAAPRLNLVVNNPSNSMNVYPNPVVDNTTLEITTSLPIPHILVTVTNMSGQVVYKTEINSGQTSIKQPLNLSNLGKGAYAVTVYFSSVEMQTIKILKL